MLFIDYSSSNDLTSEIFLNYDKSIKNHNFSLLGGVSQEAYNYDWINASRDNFPNDLLYELNAGSVGNMQNSGSAYSWKLMSYFGRFNYSFQDKYLIEANLRVDGSSRFAEDSRYGFFPSFSGGWRLSEENFMDQISWIDNLKIRASWGELGNQQIGNYPYQKTVNLGYNYPIGGEISPGAAMTTLPFEDITWETTRITNGGVDVMVLDSKLSFIVDYFYKKTIDILYPISVSNVLGMSAGERNAGAIENKGWEFELTYKDEVGDFSYSIHPNFSIVDNQVLSLASVEQDINKGLFIGHPINSFYGYVADGLFVDQEDIDSYAKQNYTAKPGFIRYKDISGPDGIPDGIVSAQYDRKVIGSRIPKYSYGAGITADYKGFDFYIQLHGLAGYYQTPVGQWIYALYNQGNIQQWQWDERWTKENPDRNAAYPRLEETGSGSPVFGQSSTYWLYDASFIRIKNIQIGYTIPKNFIPNVDKLRIYISATNLLTFDNYQKGWDPEMTLNSAHYPLLSNVVCGLNINF
jgi:TonB-linked SusC/RagA family outer membrane protein